MENPPTASKSGAAEYDGETLDTEVIPPYTDDLWLDRLVRPFGFGWLADRLPWNGTPSQLYAILSVMTLPPLIGVYGVLENSDCIKNVSRLIQPVTYVTRFRTSDLASLLLSVLHK
jgi:hypothetical protein